MSISIFARILGLKWQFLNNNGSCIGPFVCAGGVIFNMPICEAKVHKCQEMHFIWSHIIVREFCWSSLLAL